MESKRRRFHVPEELVLEVLLRLPVKSLSRFKCVSKNWYGLIVNPCFVEQHHGHESNRERLLIGFVEQNDEARNNYLMDDDDEEEEEEGEIIISPWITPPGIDDPDYAQYLYYRELFLDRENDERLLRRQANLPDIEYSYKYAYVDETFSEYAHLQIPDDEPLDVFGPLNGVFCVASHIPRGPMALLNPALRQFKPLPLVGQINERIRIYSTELGFGLDPLTGDFKLVLILQFSDNIDEHINDCIVYVCTSDSDSWRVVDDVDLTCLSRYVCGSLCNTYLNGAYYWLLHSYETIDHVPILVFDMETDKFRTIQVTGCDAQSKTGYLALSGGTFSLLMYDAFEHNGSRFIDVWRMENEGCWIKTSRVDPLQGIKQPLCFSRNNELLFETVTNLLAQCNVSTGELKTFEAKRTDKCHFPLGVYAYKESLVSIEGKAGKCKFWDTSSDFIKNFFKDASSHNVA